jgi:hypothetical protein
MQKIKTLKKHMDVNHTIIPKNFEEENNSPMTKIVEKQQSKKKPNVFGNAISKFFLCKILFLQR